MKTETIAKEMLNTNLVSKVGDFSYLLGGSLRFGFFKVLNRIGTVIGDAPGFEMTFKSRKEGDVPNQIIKFVNFFNMDLVSKEEEGDEVKIKFIDKKQTKYLRVI